MASLVVLFFRMLKTDNWSCYLSLEGKSLAYINFPYLSSFSLQCTHCKIPRISRRDKFLHAVFFLSLVIMISCAVVTVMCFLSDKGEISKFPKNKVELSTEEIITLSCGVMFFVSFFIAMTVEIKAKHTVYKLFAKFIMQNMEWKIDSYARETDYDIIHPVWKSGLNDGRSVISVDGRVWERRMVIYLILYFVEYKYIKFL